MSSNCDGCLSDSHSLVQFLLFGVLLLVISKGMQPAKTYTHMHAGTHAHMRNCFPALWILSETTRVSWYQKKHAPTHTYRGHQSSLICFLCLLRSIASSLFNLCAWQSFSTISLFIFQQDGALMLIAFNTEWLVHSKHPSSFLSGQWPQNGPGLNFDDDEI